MPGTDADAGFSSATAVSVRVMTSSRSVLIFFSSAFSRSACRADCMVSSYKINTVSDGTTSADSWMCYLQSIFFQFRLQRCHLSVPFVTHIVSREVSWVAPGPNDVLCRTGSSVDGDWRRQESNTYLLCNEEHGVETEWLNVVESTRRGVAWAGGDRTSFG